jgi:hypothetical protein
LLLTVEPSSESLPLLHVAPTTGAASRIQISLALLHSFQRLSVKDGKLLQWQVDRKL